MNKAQVLTTRELVDYMKLNKKTILKMAQKGELPGVKIGSQWRFHLEASDRYLQRDIMHTPEGELDSIINTTDHLIPLSRLFDGSLINLNLKATTGEEVLQELVNIANEAGVIDDKEKLFE